MDWLNAVFGSNKNTNNATVTSDPAPATGPASSVIANAPSTVIQPAQEKLKGKLSYLDAIDGGYLDVTVGYQQPVVTKHDPTDIAAAFMGATTDRRLWELAWRELGETLVDVGQLASEVKDDLVIRVRRAVLPPGNTIPKFTMETQFPIISRVLQQSNISPATIAAYQKKLSDAIQNFTITQSMVGVGTDVGIELNYGIGGKIDSRTGPNSLHIRNLYKQFSQTAKQYGNDAQVKNAVTTPFHQVTTRPKRLVQQQGPNALRHDIRKMIYRKSGVSRVTGLLNQPMFDNVQENRNYLVQLPETALENEEAFLGKQKYDLYMTLINMNNKTVPRTLGLSG
jgi:hypothetical protein